ncbi:MAG TPA: hypothetical protein VHE35_06040 [Kofleriaceae bacterium]|nr:hypothetical protein [Kofleriaceae bacterium]
MKRYLLALGLLVAACDGGADPDPMAFLPTRTPCVMDFSFAVTTGPSAGLSKGGSLFLPVEDDGSIAQGQLVPDGEAPIPVTGRLDRSAFELVFDLGGGQRIHGAGEALPADGVCPPMAEGTLTGPLVGDGGDWSGMASGVALVDDQGRVFIAQTAQQTILLKANLNAAAVVYAGATNQAGATDGAASSSRFHGPDPLGYFPGTRTLYVGDTGNQKVRAVKTNANPSVTSPVTKAMIASATTAAGFAAPAGFEPRGIAVDNSGLVYIADRAGYAIWRWNPTNGNIKLVAGRPGTPGTTDGTGTAARFTKLGSMSTSDDGMLLNVIDGCFIRQLSLSGTVVTLGSVATCS